MPRRGLCRGGDAGDEVFLNGMGFGADGEGVEDIEAESEIEGFVPAMVDAQTVHWVVGRAARLKPEEPRSTGIARPRRMYALWHPAVRHARGGP